MLKQNNTNRFGLLCVLVRSQVNGPGLHHGAGKQVSQLRGEARRHRLVGRRERRRHKEGRGFGCGRDDVRGVNEEARSRRGVWRHRVVDGSHSRGNSSCCRGGLVKFSLQLRLLLPTGRRCSCFQNTQYQTNSVSLQGHTLCLCLNESFCMHSETKNDSSFVNNWQKASDSQNSALHSVRKDKEVARESCCSYPWKVKSQNNNKMICTCTAA